MWDEGKGSYKVWPSEGAHSDFAPRTAKQRGLQEWIAAGYGYCELEHVRLCHRLFKSLMNGIQVACGAGLERIYTFLKSEGQIPVTDAPLLQVDNSLCMPHAHIAILYGIGTRDLEASAQ